MTLAEAVVKPELLRSARGLLFETIRAVCTTYSLGDESLKLVCAIDRLLRLAKILSRWSTFETLSAPRQMVLGVDVATSRVR